MSATITFITCINGLVKFDKAVICKSIAWLQIHLYTQITTRRVQKPHPNGFVVKLELDLFVQTCKTDGNKINPQWLSAKSLTVDIRNITYKREY